MAATAMNQDGKNKQSTKLDQHQKLHWSKDGRDTYFLPFLLHLIDVTLYKCYQQ